MANAITNYFAGVRRRWDKLQAKQEEERARDRAERAATGNEPDLSAFSSVAGLAACAIVHSFFNEKPTVCSASNAHNEYYEKGAFSNEGINYYLLFAEKEPAWAEFNDEKI